MATKFSDFLAEKKIDTRRLMAVSHLLEQLRPVDRAVKLKRRGEKDKKKKGEAWPTEVRSGRAVTPRLVQAALLGKAPLPAAGKTRLLRAVNRILEQRQAEPVDIRALF